MVLIGEQDRLTIDRLDDEGCLNLLEAFLVSLSEDYRNAMVTFLNDKKDKKSYELLTKLRYFFLSEYFYNLTGLNGKNILSSLDKPFLNKLA